MWRPLQIIGDGNSTETVGGLGFTTTPSRSPYHQPGQLWNGTAGQFRLGGRTNCLKGIGSYTAAGTILLIAGGVVGMLLLRAFVCLAGIGLDPHGSSSVAECDGHLLLMMRHGSNRMDLVTNLT